MKPTVIITAANGFIGRHLVQYLKGTYRIIALVRTLPASHHTNSSLRFRTHSHSDFTPDIKYYAWDGRTVGKWSVEFEGALAVINLAGRSVNCRYNERNKAAIYASRLESTHVIGEAIRRCGFKPAVWINAASATIYAHSEDSPNTEANGIIGTGFSVDVCRQWEAAFTAYAGLGVRQVILRTAIVLGKEGGVMVPFKRLVRFGLGGRMGRGNQQFSWIHEDDLCAAIVHLITHETSSGVYNLSAPNPVTNTMFLQTLRQKMHIPFGIPQPKWLLEFGARLIGTETELILKSRYVLPGRLLQEGFEFQYPAMDKCLEALTGNNAE